MLVKENDGKINQEISEINVSFDTIRLPASRNAGKLFPDCRQEDPNIREDSKMYGNFINEKQPDARIISSI